jgi:class 3 adenylate cyclase
MGQDEPATLAALQLHRTELISPAITKHHGRIVKLMGDGLLAEFSSVVEAVECAVEIQAGMSERNSALPESRRMLLRVGVHLGDVMVDEDDIYGDGVNIAARLESIADEGGICLSRQALDHIEDKLGLRFKTLGHRKLKNIAKPVEVYAIHLDPSALSAEHMQAPNMEQDISYCRTPDGVRLAWAKVGRGALLVKAANWMNHLEYD